MTWTYEGAPDSSTAAGRRDAVRLFVGDTDTSDQQLTDEEIAFALEQAQNDTYIAASICAQTLAGKYARQVNTKFDDVSDEASSLNEHYTKLSASLREQGRRYGTKGLGRPVAGGVSQSDMRSVDQNTDRVEPKFKQDQFANPPGDNTCDTAT